MILNSVSVEVVRRNAARLAQVIRSKDDLLDLATATSLNQVFAAIETLLTNTSMYFDDELMAQLSDDSWASFKATLLVYTLNTINQKAQGVVQQQQATVLATAQPAYHGVLPEAH